MQRRVDYTVRASWLQ